MDTPWFVFFAVLEGKKRKWRRTLCDGLLASAVLSNGAYALCPASIMVAPDAWLHWQLWDHRRLDLLGSVAVAQ